MQSKLTLRLDASLIKRAKAQARKAGKSLSQMVAEYFSLLSEESHNFSAMNLPPLTKSLHGKLRGSDANREEYQRYLEKKHR